MISPGNIPPNAYQSLSSRVMRVPMRHTFTLDQKRILMKYFEQGMVGQSLMYQEKIQQCAQEAALEFDVVRNWIGNQRRKRRLEEVQRACMQSYIDHVPTGEIPEGLPPPKHPHMVPSMNPRQTQVLFLPHMAKHNAHNMSQSQQPHHSVAPGDGAIHSSEGTHDDGQAAQVNPISLSQSIPPHQQQGVPPAQVSSHSSPRIHTRVIPPFQQPTPTSGYPGGGAPEVGANDLQSPPATAPSISHPPPRSTHISSASLATSPSMSLAGPSLQDEEIALHPTPIRGFYPTPRGGRILPGSALPIHPQQRASPPSFTIYKPKVGPPQESPEMRHHEIRRVVEQIQMSLDRLEQLGCESLLATVSTADRSAYVCGTPIALQYFSKVNKDIPMAEYIHKQVSNDLEYDHDATDDTPSEASAEGRESAASDKIKENHKEKTAPAIGQVTPEHAKSEAELTNEEEDEMALMDAAEGIIKAGEEVFLVNKDRSIIGTGMLYARPHEKITFKSSPDYAE